MADIGNTLREARIRKGLTIKDVEEITKIRGRYLQALENDDYSMLPGPTFLVAFLRTYAQFLKLDAEQLIAEYRRSHEPRSGHDSGVVRVSPGPIGKARPGRKQQKHQRRTHQRGYMFVGVMAIAVVVLLAWMGAHWGRESQTPATLGQQSVPSQDTTTTNLSSDVSTTTSEAGGSTTSSVTVVVSGGNVKLVVGVAQGSCWMVIHEDSAEGQELFAGTLPSGQQQTFDSSKRYWLRVGLPEAVTLSVNGRELKLGANDVSFTVTEAGVQPDQ